MANEFDKFDAPGNAFDKFDSPAPATPREIGALDRAHNLGSGFNAGAAGLLGLPVDTALSAWDLAKAGAGLIQSKITGKPPSQNFDPADRSEYKGSSAWLAKYLDKTPITTTQNSAPEDTASRYLHTAGSALPGVMLANPTTAGQAASAVASNVLPAMAAQGASDTFPNSRTAPILASLLTQAAPSAVSYTAKALTPKPDASTKAAAQTLENAGVQLDASQKTGGLKGLKKLVQDNPFTAGSEAQKVATQKQQFTSAALKLMGEDAPAATQPIMARAEARIGSVMDRVEANTVVPYNAKLHTELADILSDAKTELGPSSPEYGVIRSQVGNIVEKAFQSPAGGIPGDAVAASRQSLNRIGMGNNASLKHYAGQLKSVLEDAVQGAATGQDYKDYKEARQQWRIKEQITPTIDKTGDGMISPALLPNSIAKGNAGKKQFYYGRGDQRLVTLAQAGKKLIPDSFPNSGTTARAAMQAIPAAIAHAGSYLFLGGNPLPAIGVGIGTVGAPMAARGLLNSPTALTGKQTITDPRLLQYAVQNGLLSNKEINQ